MKTDNVMSQDQRKMARHALGLDQHPRSYRNYYAAGIGTDIEDRWEDLVRRGLAERGHQGGGIIGFFLTRAGAEIVLGPSESLDPEEFP